MGAYLIRFNEKLRGSSNIWSRNRMWKQAIAQPMFLTLRDCNVGGLVLQFS